MMLKFTRPAPFSAEVVLCLIGWSVGWGAAPACANASPDAVALVAQLGHAEYAVREEAASKLAALELAAHDALMTGLQTDDPEVRRRCRRILVRVLEADYQRRIDALLADEEGGEHDLPGWAWYREAIGNDAPAKDFFVSMLRAEPGLLASAAQGRTQAEEAFSLRLAQLIQQMQFPHRQLRRQPSAESVAALLLVAVHPQWRLPGALVDNGQLLNFTRSGDFLQLLNEGEHRGISRRLVGRWMLIQGAPNMAQQKLRMAVQFQINEGLPLALTMLEKPEAQNQHMVAIAAEALARLGGREHAARLLPLLTDERQIGRSGQRVIEMRDAALAWLVYATGQDLEQYGQPAGKALFQNIAQNPAIMFNFGQFGYEDAEQREAALKRWASWLEANPLPTPPEVEQSVVTDRPAGQPQQVPPPAEPSPLVAGGMQMADRALVRHLQEAERLTQTREYAAAARLLGLLLAAESDFVFRPDRDMPLYRHLKPAAEQAIGRLPDEGRAAYQLLFGAEARHLLAEAVAGGDRQVLARVSQDYFYTEAGAEAAYLLGASYWQAGQFFSAAACWQRLAESGRRALRFEPALSLQLAACWMAMGEPQRIPQRLEALKAQYAGAPLDVAGRAEDWFDDAGDALGWLVGLLGHEPTLLEAPWGVFRGRASRNPSGEGGSPYLRAEPLDVVAAGTPLRKAIDRVQDEFFGRRRAALPAMHPLIADDAMVVRTATRIRAISMASGELLWEAQPDDPLVDLLAVPGAEEDEMIAELLLTDVLSRLWQNLAYTATSSDGRLVYSVEGLRLHGMVGPPRMVVTRDGSRRLDFGALENDNVLAAYDLATGKLRWEAGGPAGEDVRALAGTYFLGPPLPLGASLYCLAEQADQTVLLVLDAATGALQWQRVLTVREEPEPQRGVIQVLGFAMPRIPPSTRANGASPSYADGILVCPINDEQVAAVDLTTRSVVWLYEGQDDRSRESLEQRRMRMMHAQSPSPRLPTDQWVDPYVVTADGHVLATPSGGDRLVCLRLLDGAEQWTAPREDGLYIGGVHEGVVAVVGRSGIRGLRLADGRPAWNDELPLPPGALPSGRGFLSGGRLYVPLSTAEVLGVDVTTGRVVSRSRSPSGIVPGNLVGLGDGVVSQSAEGLWRFDLIADRERRAARRIEENPDDAAAWAERGELLLCDGRIAEAIECLVRASDLEPTEPSRRQLTRAVTDGLWADYERFRPLAESLELDAMEPGQRASVFRALGWGAQRAGDTATALETFLELAHLDPDADAVEPLSAAVRVRRDRWLAARLDELLGEATGEVRARAETRLASFSDESRLRHLPFEPASVDVWLRTGVELADGGRHLTAELRLRTALWLAQPDARPEAVARLAELLRQQQRPRDAARLYAKLAGPLADAVSSDGRTGREMVEALAADDPAHPEHVAAPLWPAGALEANVDERDARQAIMFHAPVRVRPVAPRFDRPANIRIENVGRALYGYDDLGRQVWELPLKDMQPHIGFRNGFYLAEAAQLGDVVVVWLVSRVVAIDLSGKEPRLLWEHSTGGLGGNDPRHQHRVQLAHRRMHQQRQGGQRVADSSPLAVAHGYACFGRNEELVAVDLESGELLWARDDVAENVDLFGDARYVFAVPADGSADARVFSTLDGRELGRRALPPAGSRLTTLGRCILTWEEGAEQCAVRLVDPWTGETVWQHESPPGTQACLVGPDGFAALDPEGRLVVLRTDSGKPIVETKLEAEPKLERLHVEPYGEKFLVAANRPPEPGAQRVFVHTPIPAVNIDGKVYCVDREGRVLWDTEVLDQQLELDLPSELPVLLLGKRRQVHVPRPEGGVTAKVEYAVRCLDKRSGETLYDKVFETHGQEMEIRTADPDAGLIEVITRPISLRLTKVEQPPG